jgi:hypothetical protein
MSIIELADDQPFIFMKVGRHAGETLEEILERKRQELETAGCIFWGYGGGTMHPIQRVQPFVRSRLDTGNGIKLLMQAIDSRHPDTEVYAREFSRDGINWEPLPSGVRVRGSRYALVLNEIESSEGGALEVDLGAYQVGAGPSAGRNAANYVKGRVDKGCLDPVEGGAELTHSKIVPISFAAELAEPYAVLLRT